MGAEAGDDIVLVNPSEVVEIMKQVPKGNLITIVEICKKISNQHNVKGYCSLTTGIFIMTTAKNTIARALLREQLENVTPSGVISFSFN